MGQVQNEKFGERIRRLRRAAGFSSRDELAEAIGNPSVSATVIKNIEAGRKADISIVHLFEIAFAIGVSPIVLLLDFSKPYQEARIVGLGPNFAGATNNDLDEWFSEPAAYAPLAFATDEYREQLLETQQMYVSRGYRIAELAARLTVENVQKAVRDKKTWQADQDFEHLRTGASQAEQILRLNRQGAQRLGVDLSDGTE